jgi:hypothetical protein
MGARWSPPRRAGQTRGGAYRMKTVLKILLGIFLVLVLLGAAGYLLLSG